MSVKQMNRKTVLLNHNILFLFICTIVMGISTLAAQPGREIIYQEDFQDGKAQDWDLEAPWQLQTESANTFLHGKNHTWAIYTRGNAWTNYDLECQIKFAGDSGFHINLFLTDNDRYFIAFHPNNLNLYKESPWGTVDKLAEHEEDFSKNTWHMVEISTANDSFNITIDDKSLIQYQETNALRIGSIGFETLDKSSVYVDNIIVSRKSSAATSTFHGLGDLPGWGINSKAYGVSADGAVVVGESYSENGPEAFRWTTGSQMVGLGDLKPGRFSSSALQVAASGSVAVGNSIIDDEWGYEAFRWSAGTGMTGLDDLAGGDFYSSANDVSADGSVIVGESKSATSTEAFRWTSATGMVALGILPGSVESHAQAVSDDGSVVVGYTERSAFYWTSTGGLTNLGNGYRAYGLNPNGSVIVGILRQASGDQLVKWNAAHQADTLGVLPDKGNYTAQLYKTSKNGDIIVGYYLDSNAKEKAFIWTPAHGLLDLQYAMESIYGFDLNGWTLVAATNISDDGSTIVGWGTNPAGNTEAWIARLSAQTGVDTIKTSKVKRPREFQLHQNHPNPFNSATTIHYDLRISGRVVLKIYNLSGQTVATLTDAIQSPGRHTITWQPKALPSGLYFCRLQVGDYSQTRKFILQK
ncbi:T9SS type A sorting domain-containing protein [candidate division KSB1 bacterium]|nr:T9SS type A sorting domain-containing protein [candidate division KSB1 bacterium]